MDSENPAGAASAVSTFRPVLGPEVIGTLLDRKLITTAGRKQVIGRPILYKTTKEFLMRFGLKDVNELPSMEEFEKLVAESFQEELVPAESAAAVLSTSDAGSQMESGEASARELEPAREADVAPEEKVG